MLYEFDVQLQYKTGNRITSAKLQQIKEHKKKLAFNVIAGSGCAIDVLLVQAHTNQARVLLWHPALHVLSKQDKPRPFY